ncbi:DUF1638 domain-containing protein [Actinomadura darangshiensis]|uniref:DUF1638 domain-containing protein n=1 Tax=Actinomadura darangshiensis TaxID=705336 RepID=A0A4R5C6D1_9ACTN|nr:DUF1638 domain-containing protein [Actinomadura darangshiensis]TDD92534.1 DUF1638 domain-containing protein [Actinomadura darangshiensis]
MACGALAPHIASIARRRGWPIDVHALAPLLHNRPARIAAAVEERVRALAPRRVAVAYADCGTYGALDEVCARLDVPRLPGPHCYATFAGEERLDALLRAEPGTYLLTDFLVRSFEQTVVAELGLDRRPELRDDYFAHYTRAVWLAQSPTPELRAAADRAAASIGLPLTIVATGDGDLEAALERLLADAPEALPLDQADLRA